MRSLESVAIRLLNGRGVPAPVKPKVHGLGVAVDSGEPVTLSAKDLARHAYILGSTGCGKTTLILKLIEQDIKAGHSVCVVDLRGDLAVGALALCADLDVDPKRLRLIDLRERGGLGFNPLGGAGEPFIRALHLLDVVAAEADSWGVQLEETLRNALLLLAESGRSLIDLERVFYDDTFRHLCLRNVQDESLVAFWMRYGDMSPEKQQTWALPVLNKVTPLLAVPVLRDVLGASHCLDLGTCLAEKGSILLVSLAVDELHRSSKMLGSLIVSAISREMMARVNTPESKRNPVRLYVDEFENMASESFEGLIAEGRRFGLTLVLSHQTLSQIAPKLRSVIRNNVGVQIIFQCGYEDARVLARELPEGVEPATIRALEVGEAYVLGRSGEAVLTKFNAPRKALPPEDVAAYRATLHVEPQKPKALPAPSTAPDLEDWL